jgi:hypothetical protein
VATAHLAVTILVVVVTANHYWLDGAMALILLGVALLVIRPPGPARNASMAGSPVLPLPDGDR